MDERTIDDEFGNEWSLCARPDCGLEIVRPGKVQCWCDSKDGRLAAPPLRGDSPQPQTRILSVRATKDWADCLDVAVETEDWSLVEEIRDAVHAAHGAAWAAASPPVSAHPGVARLLARCDELDAKFPPEHRQYRAIGTVEVRALLAGGEQT